MTATQHNTIDTIPMYEHHHKIIIGVLARQPELEIENWEFRNLEKWGNGNTGVWGNEKT
jgi:hypothetical protein